MKNYERRLQALEEQKATRLSPERMSISELARQILFVFALALHGDEKARAPAIEMAQILQKSSPNGLSIYGRRTSDSVDGGTLDAQISRVLVLDAAA